MTGTAALDSAPPAAPVSLSMFNPVPIGIDEFGHRIRVRVIYKNVLATGEPGGGKSALLQIIAAHAALSARSRRLDAYDAWLSHVWTAAACSRPVLLRGSVHYADPATGEVTGTISTDDLPERVIYKPCGNRRASTCPGCAETYRRDSFHLIRAGLAGGKGIPETVAAHPVVFATFTAPSFEPVHSRPVRHHTCAGKQHCAASPNPAIPAATPNPARTAAP